MKFLITEKLSIGGDSMLIIPNFGIKNSTDETVFSMAVWQQLYDIAKYGIVLHTHTVVHHIVKIIT